MKKVIAAFLMGIMLCGTMGEYAFASDTNDSYSISTVSQLKQLLNELNEDGKITEEEEAYLKAMTNPEVSDRLMVEKMKKAFDVLPETDIKMIGLSNGDEYGMATIDLDDGYIATVEFIDLQDDSLKTESTNDMVMFAATSGSSVVSKAYGNRYFTARVNVACGGGVATLILENHYNLSEKGIKERYGIAVSNSNSFGGTISEGTPQINVATASRVGQTASLFCTYKATGTVNDVNYSQSFKMTSSLKMEGHSITLDLIDVRQGWKLYTY